MSEPLDERRRRECLGAMGIDVWLSRGPAPEPDPSLPPGHGPPAPAAASPGPGPARVARSGGAPARGVAGELDTLCATVAECRQCALHAGRIQAVFGVGAPAARCMVIGEAPGADEDRKGEPFVGRAGRLLNAMLQAMGFARGDVYIANIVKCRPPANRDPRPEEVAACATYLRRQIELVDPELILAVGRVAAQNLLGSTLPIGKMRGRDHRYADTGVPVVVTYHPAYLLRSPLEKRKVWADLLRARGMLGQAS